MTDKPNKLSDTARALLTAAATPGDHFIRPPRLSVAAVRQVVRFLLTAGLAEEVLASNAGLLKADCNLSLRNDTGKLMPSPSWRTRACPVRWGVQ
jgi:hypothetical protein